MSIWKFLFGSSEDPGDLGMPAPPQGRPQPKNLMTDNFKNLMTDNFKMTKESFCDVCSPDSPILRSVCGHKFVEPLKNGDNE